MGRIVCLIALCCCLPAARAEVAAPVLKWAWGGCFASWCQTGWYSSPAVVDVDGDGRRDVVAGAYDVVALDGMDGSLIWRAPAGGRVWPGIAVGDLDGDGQQEIVAGRSGGEVSVYRLDGALRAGWPVAAFASGEVRSLALADFDRDGRLAVVAGVAAGTSVNQVTVLAAHGGVRSGWPARHAGEAGYGWGMYNQNLAVADVDGDGHPDVFAPTDTHYVTVLDRNGGQLRAHPMYGQSSDGSARKTWAEVGVHVDHAVDLRGYAICGSEHRPNFASASPAIADVDRDGVREFVLPGNVYDCSASPYESLYYGVWLLRADRTRWAAGGFDWGAIPAQGASGPPLSENYDVIQSIAANVVPADLDGDGRDEILLPSYDGKLHAWWLDRTEHHAWPYVVPGAGRHFASEPVVADLDGDGLAEVLFASWGENGNGESGRLHVLNHRGEPLHVLNLPPARGADWSGGLAAPTLDDIDDDGELELVLQTSGAGVVAYDLPGSGGARVAWGTGRGSYRRAGIAAGDHLFADGFDG